MTPWAVSVLRTGAVTLHSGSLESWHRRGSLLVESWLLKGRFQKAERARIFSSRFQRQSGSGGPEDPTVRL